jgi:hypothetical protein
MRGRSIASSPATRILTALFCLLLAAFALQAQQTSGSVSGIVKDSQGAVVPGAQITLIDEERAAQRKQSSGVEGLFVFDLLVPSTYTVSVESAGFKKWEKKSIKLYANDRLSVNDIVLEVGQVTDTVTVEASAAQLQTESASVSGIVTSQQITELSVRDRNFMYLMRTIPGVTNIDGYHANVNGGRAEQNSFRLDGLSNMDYGDNGCCATWASMDMIAEMKVVTNSGTADLGSLSGAQINVVTKSGSQEFHGNLYYFRRHESLNANSWTNNRQGTPRGRDRMNQGGFTLGGPIYIPKLFNVNKDKLYFFVNDELWRNLSPSTTTMTTPTALERIGDFSQSRRANDSSAVVVLDPLNGRTPYAGNIVPSNRINKDMQTLMNLLPLPNVFNEVNYNFRTSNTSSYSDKLVQSYRVDYNINEKWRTYFRYTKDYSEGGNSTVMGFEKDSKGRDMGWQVSPKPDFSFVLNTTTVINPTFTNEMVLGAQSVMYQYYIDRLGPYTRSALGMSFTLPYPQTLKYDLAPRVSFSSTGNNNMPGMGSGLPYIALAHDYNIVDNLTKVFSRHTLKTGFTFELNRKDQDTWSGTNHAGSFNFNRDSANPGDTDYQYSNMLTGAYNTFNQIPKVLEGRYVWKQPEWYIADTWKVRPNLTLDLGMRFYYMMPGYDSKMQMATFDPTFWDPSKTVKLYSKALVNGKSATINPLTGVVVPNYMLGAIVPGSGDPDNGFVVAGQKGKTISLMPVRGMHYAPRFGLAWQPGFLPKTVIRTGGGIFYDRMQGNVTYDNKNFPPIVRGGNLLYGYVSDLNPSQSVLMVPPGPTGGYTGSGKIPTTINYNFTIERELPYATVLSFGYVGNVVRHLIYRQPYNDPAYGSAFLPQTQDPTVTPKYDGTTTQAINFYRPYTGIAQMDITAVGANSNYNAFQLQLNKRMSKKLSYGVAYTFSKSLGTGDSMWSGVNPWDMKGMNYGRLGFDRTHMMTANFVYNLPKFGKNGNFLDHPGIRLILNDWEMSGLIQFQSGTPVSFSYNYSSGVSNQNRQTTGQERWGPRPQFVADWRIPADKQTEFVQFNTASFVPASRGSVGRESGFNYWSNPSQIWSSPEITFMKNVMFSKDSRRYVQLRVETYNLLNHHDYNGRAMQATFKNLTDLTLTNLPDAVVGTSVTNGGRFGFGSLTGGQNPRRLQVALKIYF